MPYDVLPQWKYIIRHGFEKKKFSMNLSLVCQHLPGHTGWGGGGRGQEPLIQINFILVFYAFGGS
jgi:hypothetical protein